MTEYLQQLLMDTDHLIIDWVVLTLLILTAFMVIRIRDLLASSVLLGVFSLLMALLYLLFDAPDVALTEAAVGAGISTLLFLCTLAFTEREQRVSSTSRRLVPLMLVLVVGSALLFATEDLPAFASADAPIHQHVAPYYLEHMPEDIDIPNYVTAILGSYRGFDTMGEVGVVFTAGIGIAALLMNAPQLRPTPQPNQAPAELPAKKPKATRKPANRRKKPVAKKAAPKKTAAKKSTATKKPASTTKGGKK